MWERFLVEGLRISWKMALRGLDRGMIANLHDVLERRFSEISAWFEASLVDGDKEVVA